MKRVFISLFLIIFGIFNIYSSDIKLKTDFKIAFPVDFGEKQSDYYSLSPIVELKVDVPLYKNFGLQFSADYLYGKFKSNLFDLNSVGSYQFISVFFGLFYNIKIKNIISIIPQIEVGYFQSFMNLNSGRINRESLFCLQASLDIEKSINDNFALYAVSSFGYYDIYCPLAFGIGVAYTF